MVHDPPKIRYTVLCTSNSVAELQARWTVFAVSPQEDADNRLCIIDVPEAETLELEILCLSREWLYRRI